MQFSDRFRRFAVTSRERQIAALAQMSPGERVDLKTEIDAFKREEAINKTARVAPCSGSINVIEDGAGGGIVEFVGDARR